VDKVLLLGKVLELGDEEQRGKLLSWVMGMRQVLGKV
jgi:hypothetical protein